MDKKRISRRQFLQSALVSGVALSIPGTAMSMVQGSKVIKIDVITDLHQDIMHDGLERMQTFVDHVKKSRPDAILQLGDFAYPGEKNKQVIDLFNRAHPNHFHVIGNHDTDAGYTKEQCIQYWGMPARYYAEKVKGIWLIVLDGNEKGSPAHKGGYVSFISNKQISWLKQKLTEIREPAVIVSHQPLAGPGGVDNAPEIQQILSKAKSKILLCVNGHTHIDHHLEINGVNYVHINSASYYWVGEKYNHVSYNEGILKQHPWISKTCPYQNALFASLEIHPQKKKVFIKGTSTNWVGKSPAELNYSEPGVKAGKEIVPQIRNRKFRV